LGFRSRPIVPRTGIWSAVATTFPSPDRAPSGAANNLDHVEDGQARVLVVGNEDWAIEQAAEVLDAAGHVVLRCHDPGEPSFPCNALRTNRTCPLTAGFDVVLDMRGRPAPAGAPTPGEMGVVCGIAHGASLLIGGLSNGNPFAPWADGLIELAGDIPSAANRLRMNAFRDGAARPDRDRTVVT